jgi:leucyl aminopeptidase
VRVVNDTAVFVKEYPCFAAVDRAASLIDRHKGQIVYLEYNADAKDVTETVMLVGKVRKFKAFFKFNKHYFQGVTIDTGGVDVKTGGAMFGMSRDKLGAATVAGFFKVHIFIINCASETDEC